MTETRTRPAVGQIWRLVAPALWTLGAEGDRVRIDRVSFSEERPSDISVGYSYSGGRGGVADVRSFVACFAPVER